MKLTTMAKCACVVRLFAFATSAAAQKPRRFAIFAGYSSEADVTFAPVSSLPISLPSVSLIAQDDLPVDHQMAVACSLGTK